MSTLNNSKVTVPWCLQAKAENRKIVMLTAYDHLMTKILDETGQVDILLVGDSLGMVIQGKNDTLSVTMDESIYHTSIVARTAKRAMVVADMPFMSFQSTAYDALKNAGRLIKEGGAHAIKLEGGKRVLNQVKAIVNAGIPVMGHLGLTPQSVHAFGGFKVQGKSEYAVQQLISDAIALEDAGVFSIVLEGIPTEAARRITEHLKVPTIGIGAGSYCDGQVLVTYDMLGYSDSGPRFVKKYSLIKSIIQDAVKKYADEVITGDFPTSEYAYNMKIEENISPDIHDNIKSYKQVDPETFDDLF